MKSTLLKLASCLVLCSLFASCAQSKKVITNGYYSATIEETCEPVEKGMYAYPSSADLPIAYSVIGEIELTSTTTYNSGNVEEKRRKSMFNLALLVAMENCADGIVDVQIMSNSLYAKAVRFEEPIEPYHNPAFFYTGFAQHVENEAVRNEEEDLRASEINGATFKIILGTISLLVAYAIGGGE